MWSLQQNDISSVSKRTVQHCQGAHSIIHCFRNHWNYSRATHLQSASHTLLVHTWSWSMSVSPEMTMRFSILVSEMPPFTVCEGKRQIVNPGTDTSLPPQMPWGETLPKLTSAERLFVWEWPRAKAAVRSAILSSCIITPWQVEEENVWATDCRSETGLLVQDTNIWTDHNHLNSPIEEDQTDLKHIISSSFLCNIWVCQMTSGVRVYYCMTGIFVSVTAWLVFLGLTISLYIFNPL